MLLISPAEPKEIVQSLLKYGKTNQLPEKHYGSDFMFHAPGIGLIGVQRKEFPADFLASLRGNDRVSRELHQMKQLDMGIWILEGRGTWTNDGYLIYGGRYKYFKHELWGFINSVSLMGFSVIQLDSKQETVQYIERLLSWAAKGEHDSLFVRPKPARWGEPGSREWMLHFIQGIPGVGVGNAKKLLEFFGWQLPFSPAFDWQQLREAVGPSLATSICNLFGIEVGRDLKGKKK